MPKKNDLLRQLPSVDKLLGASQELITQYGHDAVVDALRDTLNTTRETIRNETAPTNINTANLLEAAGAQLERRFTPTLRPVINATGVIIHTNLGRAPLAESAIKAIQQNAAYNTLEFDLETGKRGSRLIHAGELITAITGAEAAMVVNNNAAATVLLLSTLAQHKEVIVSRGQLVEIGGGFRVPDIMAQSGAHLVEVGTTNRTRAADFAQAITENTALLMNIHASNFKQIGFTEQPAPAELAQIAQENGLFFVEDLGSGALLDTAPYGLDHEPTVQESLAAGCALVCFSGDKLLGGPQAGILAGKKVLVDRLKRHPLARAIRADKVTLAALTATLEHYRRGDALTEIPVWRMIARPLEDLRQTANSWTATLKSAGYDAQVIESTSTVGGGSLPGATLPTAAVALKVNAPDAFLAALRRYNPPIIARIAEDRVLLDPRTVLDGEGEILLQGLLAAR